LIKQIDYKTEET